MSISIKLKLSASAFLLCIIGAAQSVSNTPTGAKDVDQRVSRIQSCLPDPIQVKGEPNICHRLAQRMVESHVPGVSIAVVHNGVIEWARGFGVAQMGGKAVTRDTLYQAGSISKPLAAMAALHLVQEGKLTLTADVNTFLKTWKIPVAPIASGNPVTLRELLTHTAGFTVHGFPGYAVNDPVPTLVQVLNGEKPANTAPIRLESAPGTKWNYSGGGYTVMQQLLVDTAKEPFPNYSMTRFSCLLE